MTNDELLNELKIKVASGEISRSDVSNVLTLDTSNTSPESIWKKTKAHLTIAKILYVLGAAVVVLGIIFFVSQIWDDIGSFGRITTTLILGFVFAGMGSMFLKQKAESYLGSVFHAIGGLLIPLGALVTLHELNIDIVSLWPVTFVFAVVSLFYLFLTQYHKNPILTFFTIANGTVFIYLFVESIISGEFYQHADVYAYLTMVIGISYLLLAHSFKNTWNHYLVGILNFFGALGFMTAAFSRVFDSGIWEVLFFVLAIIGMAFAVYLRSRSILVVSTIFLVIHLIYITQEYFANSIGWPISLVILGLLFIGLGYLSINISKKYISQ